MHISLDRRSCCGPDGSSLTWGHNGRVMLSMLSGATWNTGFCACPSKTTYVRCYSRAHQSHPCQLPFNTYCP